MAEKKTVYPQTIKLGRQLSYDPARGVVVMRAEAWSDELEGSGREIVFSTELMEAMICHELDSPELDAEIRDIIEARNVLDVRIQAWATAVQKRAESMGLGLDVRPIGDGEATLVITKQIETEQ